MRQHHKNKQGSNKAKRRKAWDRGKEILDSMDLGSPVTKQKRRMAFAEARKQARREMKK